jgi:hypothetical protein
MKVCGQCGRENPAGARFCAVCGLGFTEQGTSPPTSPDSGSPRGATSFLWGVGGAVAVVCALEAGFLLFSHAAPRGTESLVFMLVAAVLGFLWGRSAHARWPR